jgi:putative spermidine/putrescine transport system substrate-binding protein
MRNYFNQYLKGHLEVNNINGGGIMKNKSFNCILTIAIGCLFLAQNIIPQAKAASNYEGTLIISVWGGATEEWFRKAPEPKFKKLYPNVNVIYDVGGMSARYNKLLAQKNNPEIDIFISSSEVVFAASSKGLLKKINKKNIPHMNDLYKWALPAPEYGAAYGAIAEGLCYNPSFFGSNPPNSWRDLWRADVQGKIAVPAIGHSQMPQFIVEAAELHGGNIKNIEPGLKALAKLKPAAQTYFYTNWNALFNAGDVVLAVDFDYYCNIMKDSGSNIEFVIPKEGGWGSVQHASIVVGTENIEMVEKFINILISPDVQHSIAYDLMNAPARRDIKLNQSLKKRMAAGGESLNNIDWFDEEYSAKVRSKWTEMMKETVAPAWAGE